MNFQFPQMSADIFHYTSENGILGIFQKDKIVLQLTKADCMNDISEGKEIFDSLKRVCTKLHDTGKLDDERYEAILNIKENIPETLPVGWFMRNVDQNSFEGSIFEKGEQADGIIMMNKTCDIYLMSFCKKSDLLPMWNYYAAYGQQGYAIHFRRDTLPLLHDSKECYADVVDVIYKDSEKDKIVEEVILSSLPVHDYLKYISDWLSVYRYQFKNSAFEHEQEVRYLVGIPQKPEKETYEIKFKTKKGSIIPYIELKLDAHKQFTVTGVTIGPFADVELVKRNLQFYLDHQNHYFASINIQTTHIPVRF